MMGQRERGERKGGRGVECWMGDGVASRRCWERPTRQTEGGTAILSIRVGMCFCVCLWVIDMSDISMDDEGEPCFW